MNLHHLLKERIESRYGGQLQSAPQLRQDALQLQFDTGLVMELRYFSSQEYALHWLWGEAELRIDTAPLHRNLSTFPNHFHDAYAQLRPDPVTAPGRDPWENVRQLIDRLLDDPLLQPA